MLFRRSRDRGDRFFPLMDNKAYLIQFIILVKLTIVDESYFNMIKPMALDMKDFWSLTHEAFDKSVASNPEIGMSFLSCTSSDDNLLIYWKLKQPQGIQIILASCKLELQAGTSATGNLLKLVVESKTATIEIQQLAQSLNQVTEEKAELVKCLNKMEEKHKRWEETVFMRVTF